MFTRGWRPLHLALIMAHEHQSIDITEWLCWLLGFGETQFGSKAPYPCAVDAKSMDQPHRGRFVHVQSICEDDWQHACGWVCRISSVEEGNPVIYQVNEVLNLLWSITMQPLVDGALVTNDTGKYCFKGSSRFLDLRFSFYAGDHVTCSYPVMLQFERLDQQRATPMKTHVRLCPMTRVKVVIHRWTGHVELISPDHRTDVH